MDLAGERWLNSAIAEMSGMSLWFSGSAAFPRNQRMAALSDGNGCGWLTLSVQIGSSGTLLSALFNLPDIIQYADTCASLRRFAARIRPNAAFGGSRHSASVGINSAGF